MKILKISVPDGFLMLKKGFTISFLTKTRVDSNSNNEDLLELEDDFYYPKETAFIGKNSSGKTSVLKLITLALNFLKFGRIYPFESIKEYFSIDILFYSNGKIFKYYGKFAKPVTGINFLTIISENLQYTTKKDYYTKDFSNASFNNVNGFVANNGIDTSFVTKFIEERRDFSCSINLIELLNDGLEQFCLLLDKEVMNNIIKLFDDSVEFINLPLDETGKPIRNNTFIFKRIGENPVSLTASDLKNQLSAGTIRGIKFYASAITAFKLGGTIVVDEIEKNFNKNLIYNLIDMFNDEDINKAGATLVYSTHYAEILDNSSRCDNINVMHRVGNEISIKNMCTDYNLRTELKKSDQFDQNAFDNLINYDALMTLKRSLRK